MKDVERGRKRERENERKRGSKKQVRGRGRERERIYRKIKIGSIEKNREGIREEREGRGTMRVCEKYNDR